MDKRYLYLSVNDMNAALTYYLNHVQYRAETPIEVMDSKQIFNGDHSNMFRLTIEPRVAVTTSILEEQGNG